MEGWTILSRLSFGIFVAATFLALLLSYPTFRVWVSSADTLNQLEPNERTSLMGRAAVPGIEFGSAYQIRLLIDSGRLNQRARENLLIDFNAAIRQRLDTIGIIEYSVRPTAENEVIVSVPASQDTTLIRWLLTRPGVVSYHLFKDGSVVQTLRQRIDTALLTRSQMDSLSSGTSIVETLSGSLASLSTEEGVSDVVVSEPSVARVTALLADTTVQRMIRGFNLGNPPAGRFVWASEMIERDGNRYLPLYFVDQEANVSATLTGTEVVDVPEGSPLASRAAYAVRVSLDAVGRQALSNVTASNVGNRLGILIDGKVVVTLTLQGRVTDGRSELPAGKTLAEARTMAAILKSGPLPGPVTALKVESLSATADSRVSGLVIWGVSAVATGLLLALFYQRQGAVAFFGLAYHLLMSVALLRLWNIAGYSVLLTFGTLAGWAISFALLLCSYLLLFQFIASETDDRRRPNWGSAFIGIRPYLIWTHGVLMGIAALFVGIGYGALIHTGIGLFSGTVASLLTLLLLTEMVLTAASSEGRFWK